MVPIHPLVVHFPVALLIVAAVFYAISLRWKEAVNAAFILHCIGLAGAVLALLTGDIAGENIIEPDAAFEQLMGTHETMGQLSTWVFGLMLLWPLLRRISAGTTERVAFLITYMTACGLMAWGAHMGARLVYEHGAGVLSL